VTGFFTLKGFRPSQIQTKLSDVYHEQVFQLWAVERWHLHFVDKTRDLDDSPGVGSGDISLAIRRISR
jgi:hypothetical protein